MLHDYSDSYILILYYRISQLFPKLQSPFAPEKGKVQDNSVEVVGPPTPKPPSAMKMRCPMDFKAPDIPLDGIYGLDRVSRHATFWSFGLLALGQAATAAFLPEVIFFTSPILFALIGGWHQDQRHLRGSGGSLSPEKYAVTSNIPFLRLLEGKQSWKDLSDELKWSNATISMFISSSIVMLRKVR